ncbi:MAG: squalene--hopene cyclase [Actinomycetota bacterium]
MPPLAAPPDLVAAARHALARGREHLLSLQEPDGSWCAELETNVTITAEHLFLLSAFGLAGDEDRRMVANEILATQGDDGGWPLWFGGPGDLSAAVEAYYALRLAGIPADHPALARARGFVLDRGGANRARFFTKLWLAVLGEYPWSALPQLPPELVFLPPRAPLSIYRFACWARGTFVPLMVVLSLHPTYPQPVGARELFAEEPGEGPMPAPRTPGRWTPWFERGLRLAAAYGRRPVRAVRRRAYRRIARWIVERQEADGSWGGIQPPWVYSLISLHALGYGLDDPVMARGVAGLDTFVIRDGDRLRMQGCVSPVWDTCLAAIALADSGVSGDDPRLARARDWLLAKEVSTYGDWHDYLRRGHPGGWSFEHANEWYPDTDDTAEVLLALLKCGVPAGDGAVRRAVDWLRLMQSANGGWGSFDVDNDRRYMTQLPLCDFGEVIDWPTEDVTGHIVEALCACGVPRDDPAVRRAVDYLWREQRPDGSWWGRWGVNHVYGTGAALPALAAAGEDMAGPGARRAVAWLADHQNPDGGWGEDVRSYADPAWVGRGTSTASQTAWALLGLLAAQPDHPAVARGVRFLVETQKDDGSWGENQFTGTGFPMDFMINYHYYRLYFPVTALARFVA